MVLRQSRAFAAVLALGAIALPFGAGAQEAPPPAPAAAPPSYARPSAPSNDEVITGRVVSFDGQYNLQVRDDRGYIDNVRLRQGTIINPTGLRLAPGQSVTIHGVNAGSAFDANEIDTPYQDYGVDPWGYPAYGYPVYPYPAYGGWWGPSVGIGFRFGPYHRW